MFNPIVSLFRFALAGIAVLALSVGLTGCGPDSAPPPAPQNDHHDHDHDHDHDHGHHHHGDANGDVRAAVDTAQEQIAADAELQRQLAEYPLDTCLVMAGEGLEDHGGAVDFVHEGRVIRFCCTGCVAEFLDDPEPVLAQLDEALEKAADDLSD